MPCFCYLPLYVFCGRHLLAAKLRRSNIDASAGAVGEVACIRCASAEQEIDRVRLAPRHQRLTGEAAVGAEQGANSQPALANLRDDRLVEEIGGELAEAALESATTGTSSSVSRLTTVIDAG